MEFESGVITEPKVNGTKVVAEVRPIYDEIIITRTIETNFMTMAKVLFFELEMIY